MTISKHSNKPWLALTALALAAPLSHAQQITLPPIKLYGLVNAEIESVEANGGTTPYARRGRVSDGNSRLGITGNFAVDDELKAVWQLEGSLNSFDQGGVDDQGNSATLTSRNSFVGLEHARFGRLLVGNYDSAYRSLVGSGGDFGGNNGLSVQGLDLWNNTSAQVTGNSTSLFSRGEARLKNSVHYFSPVWYGLQGAASYGYDEARADGQNHSRVSLALKYQRGNFQLGLGFDQRNNTGVDVDNLEDGYGFKVTNEDGAKTRFVKLLASYKLPTHTYIGIGVEQGRYGFSQFVAPTSSNFYARTNKGTMKQVGLMGSLAQELGDRATLMFSVAQIGKLKDTVFGDEGDYKATQVSVGGKYRLNDLLTVYTYYTRIRNKPQQSANLGQDPLYSVDSGSSSAYLSPGDSPQAVGVGLIARF